MELTNEDILHEILEQIDLLDDIYTYIGDKKYKLSKKHLVTIFALNIILVIEGGRLAYRAGDDIPIKLFDFIMKYQELIYLPYPKEEPLIILRKNKSRVLNILKNHLEDFSVGISKVLGYDYNGSDWYGGYKPMYSVSYEAIDSNDINYTLYTFRMPVNKYTDEIRNKIITKQKIFNDILSNYNYDVIISVEYQPKEGDGNGIILDYLP